MAHSLHYQWRDKLKSGLRNNGQPGRTPITRGIDATYIASLRPVARGSTGPFGNRRVWPRSEICRVFLQQSRFLLRQAARKPLAAILNLTAVGTNSPAAFQNSFPPPPSRPESPLSGGVNKTRATKTDPRNDTRFLLRQAVRTK